MTANNKNIHLQNRGKNPFSVPEGYFNTLEDTVMEKIQEEEGTIKVPLLKVMKPYLYMAAGFLLIFWVGRTILSNSEHTGNALTANELSADEEMDLIYSEVDDFTITNYLLENELDEQSN